MRTVFADTYYYIAMLNPRDDGHERAMAFTTELELTEALTADHHFEQAGFVALLKP